MELVRMGLLGLAVMWMLQLIAGWAHLRYYRNVVRDTVRTHASGYLGVGTVKSRVGPGAVAIVVIDEGATVREVVSMSGVSVFARFAPLPELRGGSIGEFGQRVAAATLKPRVKRALHDAIEMATRTAAQHQAVAPA